MLETAPVPSRLWLLLIPCAIVIVALEELRKWVVRRGLRGARRPDGPSPDLLSTAIQAERTSPSANRRVPVLDARLPSFRAARSVRQKEKWNRK